MGKPYKEFWKQTGKKGDVRGRGLHWEFKSRHDEFALAHHFAGEGNRIRNGSTMRYGRKIDGSGTDAFGVDADGNMVKEWPYLALEVTFPVGHEDLVQELGEELRECVARFMHERELLWPEEDEPSAPA